MSLSQSSMQAIARPDPTVVLTLFGMIYVAIALIANIAGAALSTPSDPSVIFGGVLLIAAICGALNARAAARLLCSQTRAFTALGLLAFYVALSDPGATAIYAGGAFLVALGPFLGRKALFIGTPVLMGAYTLSIATHPAELALLEAWYVQASLPSYGWMISYVGLLVLGIAAAVIGELFERVATAAADERRRLSRDLHDTVAKTLQGALLLSSSLPEWVERDPERASQVAREMVRSIRIADGESRRIINGLRFNDTGADLPTAISVHAGRLGRTSGLKVTVTTEAIPTLDEEVLNDMFAVFVEALANVEAHSDADAVSVALTRRGGLVTLRVHDNGRGADLDAIRGHEGHYGLLGMAERVRRHGGSFEISTRPDEGFTISATVPVSSGNPGPAAPGQDRPESALIANGG